MRRERAAAYALGLILWAAVTFVVVAELTGIITLAFLGGRLSA
jgi:hypothetical protein